MTLSTLWSKIHWARTASYDTVLNIHEKLNELIEAQKDEPEPVILTKSEVKRLFEECGVEDEKLQSFDEQYEITAGEKSSLVASNITIHQRFEIKTPDVVVHVDPERADLVETRVIDGRKCLVIPMEGEVELNGIRVHTGVKILRTRNQRKILTKNSAPANPLTQKTSMQHPVKQHQEETSDEQ